MIHINLKRSEYRYARFPFPFCFIIFSFFIKKQIGSIQKIFDTVIYLYNNIIYPNILSKTPAAMADPITPATFGPIACISKKFDGLDSCPTF